MAAPKVIRSGADEEINYVLILTVYPDGGATYRCGRGKGGEAFLKLHSSVAAAEAHAMLENLDPATTRIVERPMEHVCAFVEVFAPGNFEYVAIDPPLTIEDGPPQPVSAITVEEFVEVFDRG